MTKYYIDPLGIKEEYIPLLEMLCYINNDTREGIYQKYDDIRLENYNNLNEHIIEHNIPNDFVNMLIEIVNDIDNTYYIGCGIIITTTDGTRHLTDYGAYIECSLPRKGVDIDDLKYVNTCFGWYLREKDITGAQRDKLLEYCSLFKQIIMLNEYKRKYNIPIKFVYGSLRHEMVIDYIIHEFNAEPTYEFMKEADLIERLRELNIELSKKYKKKDSSDICSLMVLLSDNYFKF